MRGRAAGSASCDGEAFGWHEQRDNRGLFSWGLAALGLSDGQHYQPTRSNAMKSRLLQSWLDLLFERPEQPQATRHQPTDAERVQLALRNGFDTGNALSDAWDHVLLVMDGCEFECALVDLTDQGPPLSDFVGCLRSKYIELVCRDLDTDRPNYAGMTP